MNPNNDKSCAAFPVLKRRSQGLELADTGMSLRDYFAAKALQGLLASNVCASMGEFTRHSYEVADAMLEARER